VNIHFLAHVPEHVGKVTRAADARALVPGTAGRDDRSVALRRGGG
jgi:hypothetical protein